MYRLRPTKYDHVPRQTESQGIAAIRLPLARLISQYVPDLLRRALLRLWYGRRPPDCDEWLPAHDLRGDAITLDEWFANLRPAPLSLEWRADGLRQLADSADDLAEDQGRWTDQAEETADIVREATHEIRDRVQRLRDAVTHEYGPRAATHVLQDLHRRMSQCRDSVQTDPRRWNAQRADELRITARRLRAMSRPRQIHWRLLLWLRPDLSSKRWLTTAQQALVRTRLLPAIEHAAELRFADQIRRYRSLAYEHILGRPGRPGIMQGALQPLRDHKRLLETLRDALNDATQPIPQTGNEILLVDNLQAVLDPSGILRFVDLLDQQVERSGCTPQGLADELLRDGLSVGCRTYFPSQWTALPAPRLLGALRASVAKYLGYNDLRAPINLRRPRTAVEHAAAITLDHPALRHILQEKTVDLARRSRPFALFTPIAGALPRAHAYLFCHSDHKKLFEQLLRVQCNVTNRTNGHPWPDRTYQLRSPYLVTLVQYALAAPGGAQRDLHVAIRHANRVRRDATVPPLFARQDYPEVRLLEERPDDGCDAQELLLAARAANVVVPSGRESDRFQLSKEEPRLQHIFLETQLNPEPRSADFFRQQLASSEFVNFVSVMFPALLDWRRDIENLRLEHTADTVAVKLASLGILTPHPGGLYIIAAVPAQQNRDIPAGLYTTTSTGLRGLTEERFVAELVKNDWLYNVIFWQTLDAYDLGRIAPDQLPQFLKEYLKRLD